jgi:hypothetical protein
VTLDQVLAISRRAPLNSGAIRASTASRCWCRTRPSCCSSSRSTRGPRSSESARTRPPTRCPQAPSWSSPWPTCSPPPRSVRERTGGTLDCMLVATFRRGAWRDDVSCVRCPPRYGIDRIRNNRPETTTQSQIGVKEGASLVMKGWPGSSPAHGSRFTTRKAAQPRGRFVHRSRRSRITTRVRPPHAPA